MEHGSSPTHRLLINELMQRGWYRAGSDASPEDTGRRWHFRHGHQIDGPSGPQVSVQAGNELQAMRAMVLHLRRAEEDRRSVAALGTAAVPRDYRLRETRKSVSRASQRRGARGPSGAGLRPLPGDSERRHPGW
jgi:hypothetical protein